MKKLKLQLEDLAVESFTTADEKDGRGTVEGYNSCQTCQDIDCSAVCTGTSCDGTGTGGGDTGGTTPCGPGGSDPVFGCGSGVQGCRTYYDWTGCDYSCVWGPCESFEECSLGGC
jgi:hypothetical protein